MTTLPEAGRALVDAPEMATVATLEPDGQPQLSVVWVTRDGDDILFSTTRGRRKTANLERSPKVTVLMYPAANPYSYLEVRGTATIEDDPTSALINQLSHKYVGSDYTMDGPDAQRVIVRVTPEKVLFRG